jgi:hypothetical protein
MALAYGTCFKNRYVARVASARGPDATMTARVRRDEVVGMLAPILDALPFVSLAVVATMGFQFFWKMSVAREDDEPSTKIATFVVFLALVVILIRLWQSL